jgi:hypothetical protein
VAADWGKVVRELRRCPSSRDAFAGFGPGEHVGETPSDAPSWKADRSGELAERNPAANRGAMCADEGSNLLLL